MAPCRAAWALRCLSRGATLMAGLGLAGAAAGETIIGATFDDPTDRYRHGVLGDAIEFGTLVIEVEDWSNTTRYRIHLPEDHVFEDLVPRLWDVTGDGAPEVVVIETDVNLGAALAVYDQSGKIAETPHIGQSNRWLAPVGAADFDGDGRTEVALVDRPHLAKVLRVFEWDGSALVLDAEIAGLTNHRIGEDFIFGGVRDCGTGPQIVTADADWSNIMVTAFDQEWASNSMGVFSPERMSEILDCK